MVKFKGYLFSLMVISLVFCFTAMAQNVTKDNAQVEKGKAVAKETKKVDPDKDLENYKSEIVRKRIKNFRTIIRQQKTRQAKINKALKLMYDKKSIYRADAIMFLANVKAQGVLDDFYRVAKKEKTLRGHVVLAYRQMADASAIPYLIRLMNAPNVNVRNAAYEAIVKLSQVDFDFDPEDSKENRKAVIKQYQEWWKKNKEALSQKKISKEEQEEAEKKWQLYGAPYLNR